MNFCHICGLKLTLGNENFCPKCGTNLQQKIATVGSGKMTDNNQLVDIQHTGGDVIGTGFSGSGNITAKDTKGNIIYFHIDNVSSEQLRNIITSSTTLDVSESYKTADNTKNIRELHNVTETKQQTGQVLEEINKVEKGQGREIQEIKVGELQISKNELLLKEHILKGNEYYYKREYEKAIECYDKVLEIDPKYAYAWNNKCLALDNLGKHNEAIKCYDKVLEIDPKDAYAWNNKGNALYNLGKHNEAIECYDKVLEIDPKDDKALANRNLALKLLGRQPGGGKKSGWKRFFK
jgi:tetratricopeptide (TPR) repeat protein